MASFCLIPVLCCTQQNMYQQIHHRQHTCLASPILCSPQPSSKVKLCQQLVSRQGLQLLCCIHGIRCRTGNSFLACKDYAHVRAVTVGDVITSDTRVDRHEAVTSQPGHTNCQDRVHYLLVCSFEGLRIDKKLQRPLEQPYSNPGPKHMTSYSCLSDTGVEATYRLHDVCMNLRATTVAGLRLADRTVMDKHFTQSIACLLALVSQMMATSGSLKSGANPHFNAHE